MDSPDSLVNEETLALFGDPSELNIDLLAKHIFILNKNLPAINKDTTFFQDLKRSFVINKDPQDLESLYHNLGAYFSNCINWNSPKTQFNITPPTVIPAVAVSSIVSLVNPNMVWDVASGSFAELERGLAGYVAGLVNWHNSFGIFTFGGTGTDMYAIKIGINKADKSALDKGVKDSVVISNDEGHSCHVTLCNWLGVGTSNCIRVKTSREGVVSSEGIISVAEQVLKEKKKLACIILNGGTNFNGKIDPIRQVVVAIEALANKFQLDYKPHIHVDSVIGWVFLLFKDYDFNKNELKFPTNVNDKLRLIYSQIKDISFADSFGVDFHKTGFCPYLASLFVVKNSRDMALLAGKDMLFTHQSFNFGDYKPGEFTLETSRPANGIVAAYASINSLGINGLRRIFANFLYVAEDLRARLKGFDSFELCNPDALGWATLFVVKPNKLSKSYSSLYDCFDQDYVLGHNQFQKEFYNFLINKYDSKLPWNIGFSKCYKQNAQGFQISALKNYPMSPFVSRSDNALFVSWLNDNLSEFNNETKV